VERSLPTEVVVSVSALEFESSAQCHLCPVVSTIRLQPDDLGNIGAASLAAIRAILGDLLDIP
jgi:hypothetical protein